MQPVFLARADSRAADALDHGLLNIGVTPGYRSSRMRALINDMLITRTVYRGLEYEFDPTGPEKRITVIRSVSM